MQTNGPKQVNKAIKKGDNDNRTHHNVNSEDKNLSINNTSFSNNQGGNVFKRETSILL